MRVQMPSSLKLNFGSWGHMACSKTYSFWNKFVQLFVVPMERLSNTSDILLQFFWTESVSMLSQKLTSGSLDNLRKRGCRHLRWKMNGSDQFPRSRFPASVLWDFIKTSYETWLVRWCKKALELLSDQASLRSSTSAFKPIFSTLNNFVSQKAIHITLFYEVRLLR